MIQAPSRYAKIIRVIVPFAAFSGLGYLFLITFAPLHFQAAMPGSRIEGTQGIEGFLVEHPELSWQKSPSEELVPELVLRDALEKDHVYTGEVGENHRYIGRPPSNGLSEGVHLERQEEQRELQQQRHPYQQQHHHHIEALDQSLDASEHQFIQDYNGNTVDSDDTSDTDIWPFESVEDLLWINGESGVGQQVHEVEKANGALVILTCDDDLQLARETIRQIEDRFNRGRNYPWVVLSPFPLSARSQNLIRHLSMGNMTFGAIPREQWRLPKWIDAAKVRNRDYAKMKLGMNKTSLVERHKWRYMSGFLAQHELLDPYEFFWRVDSGVDIFCDVEEDPMLTMKKSGQKFAWSLSSSVNEAGVSEAWSVIQRIKGALSHFIPEVNDEDFLTRESGDIFAACAYGVQNSVARVDFFRSPEYEAYFEFVDQEGPIYYEKWDDATVITIGLALLTPRTDVLFLEELGWSQGVIAYCPKSCPCDPAYNNQALHLSYLEKAIPSD
ncbi:alpha 1,2-mannosyltransferase 2.4.1 [Dissophora ornata]|nr:alpha 1,2-mannosyltransferase 2.4.1 [Dissophora ornata]